MRLTHCIWGIALYSIMLVLAVVVSAIESHIHPVAENVRWTPLSIGLIGVLGLLTYSALQSVEKRIVDLEEKLKKGS
ncbi:MAG TPA: hypothetical protein VIH42_07685 [Thermoguttaceae bacterium]